MRRFGFVLVVAGVAAFFYCQQRMEEYPAPPAGLAIEEAWRYPQERWRVGQYAAGFLGFVGGLLLMFPKGR